MPLGSVIVSQRCRVFFVGPSGNDRLLINSPLPLLVVSKNLLHPEACTRVDALQLVDRLAGLIPPATLCFDRSASP